MSFHEENFILNVTKSYRDRLWFVKTAGFHRFFDIGARCAKASDGKRRFGIESDRQESGERPLPIRFVFAYNAL